MFFSLLVQPTDVIPEGLLHGHGWCGRCRGERAGGNSILKSQADHHDPYRHTSQTCSTPDREGNRRWRRIHEPLHWWTGGVICCLNFFYCNNLVILCTHPYISNIIGKKNNMNHYLYSTKFFKQWKPPQMPKYNKRKKKREPWSWTRTRTSVIITTTIINNQIITGAKLDTFLGTSTASLPLLFESGCFVQHISGILVHVQLGKSHRLHVKCCWPVWINTLCLHCVS